MAEIEISRRGLLRMVGIMAGTALVMSMPHLALADDGTGTGDSSGKVIGGDASSYYGFMWVWDDTFADPDPKYGWNEASRNAFWSGPMRNRWNQVGNALFGTSRTFGWHAYDYVVSQYNVAADQALARARQRAGASRARIVAAGWSTGYYTRDNVGTMYINQWSHDRTRDNMLRSGAATSILNRNDGWGQGAGATDGHPNYVWGNAIGDLRANSTKYNDWKREATESGTHYNTWTDLLWHRYQVGFDASSRTFTFLVIAVAEGEPPATGKLRLKKSTSSTF